MRRPKVRLGSVQSIWSQVLPHLVVHQDAVVASDEHLAWVVRKNNPQLKRLLDEFIEPRTRGTSFGNTLLRRLVADVYHSPRRKSPSQT